MICPPSRRIQVLWLFVTSGYYTWSGGWRSFVDAPSFLAVAPSTTGRGMAAGALSSSRLHDFVADLDR
jgi:hypothetical protein